MKSSISVFVLAAAVFASTNAFAVDPIVRTVGPSGSGATYTNIASALGSISDASASKPYEIFVYPGTYTGRYNGGGGMVWQSYVSLRGADRDSTILRGSAWDSGVIIAYDTTLFNFEGVQGVEVSNITLDGSAQMTLTENLYNSHGSLCVGGASMTFSHVRLINGNPYYSAGFTLNDDIPPCGPGYGDITVLDSEVGAVADGGGDWTFQNTSILATHDGAPEYIFAFAHDGNEVSGNVTFIGCTIEAHATGSGPTSETNPIWLAGTMSGEIRIIDSTVIANDDVSSPAGITAPIINEASATGTTIVVQGSELQYVSHSGVSSGEFYGVYQAPGSNVPVKLSSSAIRSIGSGGTRADIDNDAAQANVVVVATDAPTVTGNGTTTSDLRQGQFSSDLIIPLSAPTLGPVNGQIWVDTSTNKLCYRSGGTTRCVLGN